MASCGRPSEKEKQGYQENTHEGTLLCGRNRAPISVNFDVCRGLTINALMMLLSVSSPTPPPFSIPSTTNEEWFFVVE